MLSNQSIIFDKIETAISLPIPNMNSKYSFHNHKSFSELYEPLVAIYDEEMQQWYDYDGATAHLATTKYISVTAHFTSNDLVPRRYSILTAVTIDFEKQEQITLDDLVNIDDEFVQLLQENKLGKTDEDPALLEEFGDYTDFSKYSTNELEQLLSLCSKPSNKENCWDKPIFFLSPGRLWIATFPGSGNAFYIQLKDIEKFLKVEKW